MNQLRLLLSALILLLGAYSAEAQCTIKPSATRGCIPQPISFSVNTSGKVIKTILWTFGDGSTSDQKTPTHVYQKRGQYKVSVTITFVDGTDCSVEYPTGLNIFDNPSAVFDLKKQYFRCNDDPEVEFKQASTRSREKADIVRYVWDLGDGDTSQRSTPRHTYERNGDYLVKLSITDANGCSDTVTQKVNIQVFEEIEARLAKTRQDSCPLTIMVLRNLTDTAGLHINRVKWNMDNGDVFETTKKEANWTEVWRSAKSTYYGNKTFVPRLTVWNWYGCMDSIAPVEINNIFFKFDAQAKPPVQCYGDRDGGPGVSFTTSGVPRATYTWDFGDPGSSLNNSNSQNPGHLYGQPGFYKIVLKIAVGDCVRDTSFCEMVKIYGPAAKINKYPTDYNDAKKDHKFYPNTFPNNFDTCLNTEYTYYTLDTQRVTKYRYKYCNSDKLDSTAFQFVRACPKDYSRYDYKLKPVDSFAYQGDAVTRIENIWRKGMPLPEGPVFSKYRGDFIKENIHDSDIFATNCGAPHTVFFKNNSIKFRGFEALDNFPRGYADSCKNPSYPWASDSLEYLWDFGEGTPDTATLTSPDPLARYSTERVPSHTYTVDGCYQVILKAYDPVMDCRHKNDLYIVVMPPDAGWDTVAFDTIERMDYLTQKELEKQGRRGMILEGLQCQSYGQYTIIDEMLPNCRMEMFWIVFDSAKQTTATICGPDTFLTHEWKQSAKDPLGKDPLRWNYDTPGWKTMGVVVKNGDCFDTVWYHNYKYIYSASSDISASIDHICPGDSVDFNFTDTLQEGIQYAWFEFNYLGGDGTEEEAGTDTLDYLIYKDKHITSSLHNTESGVVDDTVYNNLSQTVTKIFPKPGVYTVTGKVLQRFECSYSDDVAIAVGHYAKIEPEFFEVCANDSFRFFDTIRYFHPLGLNSTPYWEDPELYHGPDTPRHYEQIHWDFNDDGIIDWKGSNPKWAYEKPGAYTVVVYTKDSLGCDWQVNRRKNLIKVVSLKADFKVTNDDSVRFCAPQVVIFEDETVFDDGGAGADSRIRFWIFEWGDGGDDAVKSQLDNRRVGHLYNHNGEYVINMTVRLTTYDSTQGDGCLFQVARKLVVEGPRPKFELEGDSVGCMPFLATVRDQSSKVSVWEWRLGDGRTKASSGESLVNLTYTEPGVYCISLSGGDEIIDFEGDTLYCVDNYPHDPCKIKVRVLPKDTLDLEHQSLLCLNETGTFDLSKSDDEFTQYRLAFNTDTFDIVEPTFQRAFDKRDSVNIFFTGIGPACPDTSYSRLDIIGIKADFNIDSSRLDTPVFWFNNLSQEGKEFDWTFEGNLTTVSDAEPIRYEYESSGEHEICLVAYNARGCSDTICKWLKIEIDVWVPNVMTPNNDDLNDEFKISIKGHTEYDLIIFNRWGEKVFESDQFNYRWNGDVFNTLGPCPAGTYFYIFNYRLIGQDPKRKNGTITLLRN